MDRDTVVALGIIVAVLQVLWAIAVLVLLSHIQRNTRLLVEWEDYKDRLRQGSAT